MENRGLIFIPDISGFTKFVNEIEINHTRLIIQELLELLINSNQIGLEVSEIEGDAILFYRFGDSPSLEEIYKQVEKMFCEFHKHLLAYEMLRYCQCKACNAAINLSLKVVTHYGEFTGYRVKNFNKLIGKDVIVAHQLLKNDIEKHEYWIVTPQLAGEDNPPAGFREWMKWFSSKKQTDNGTLTFHYTQLSRLKSEITPEQFPKLGLDKKTKMLSFSKEYETDIITLFHAAGSFNHRHRWLEGVKSVEEVNHFLPRVGMKCRYIMENGEMVIYSNSYSFNPNRIEFSETDENKNSSVYFTLESSGTNKTNLTIDYYIRKNFISQIIFNLNERKQIEERYNKSLLNLVELVKEIKIN